jgi:hypothetical protein
VVRAKSNSKKGTGFKVSLNIKTVPFDSLSPSQQIAWKRLWDILFEKAGKQYLENCDKELKADD